MEKVKQSPDNNKECFEGIIFILRTGCQWKELPSVYPAQSMTDCKAGESQLYSRIYGRIYS